jgi:HEAT repeat protein
MKKRPFLCVSISLLVVLAAAPAAYYLWAKLHGEHFYRAMPTSYWSREVSRWSKDKDHWTAPWPERMLALIAGRKAPRAPACLEGDPKALPILRDLAQDDNAHIRHLGLVYLSAFPLDAESEALILASLRHTEPKVRWAAVFALHAFARLSKDKMAAALDGLSHGVADSDASVRMQAVETAWSFGPEVVPHLALALDDPEKGIRGEAIEILSRYGHDAKPAIPRLVETALKDKDAELREWAASTVRAIDPKAAAEAGLTKGGRRERLLNGGKE